MDAFGEIFHHRQRGVVGHVDREHFHLTKQRVDVGLVDIGRQIAAPEASIERLRFSLEDLGDDLGVVGLEQFWPGLADNFDVGRKALQIKPELSGGVAAIGIVGRAGRPFLQAFCLRNRRCVAAANDRVMHALACGAEGIGDMLLGIGRQRRGFRVGVNAEHAEIARHFMHRERAR